jgi:hypothetical protein
MFSRLLRLNSLGKELLIDQASLRCSAADFPPSCILMFLGRSSVPNLQSRHERVKSFTLRQLGLDIELEKKTWYSTSPIFDTFPVDISLTRREI